MRDMAQTGERLREASDELKRRGIDDLAQTVDRAIADLRGDALAASALLTTGEAADILGVRSINTIKRWVLDGILEGFRRGGRILISRASVDAMLNDSRLAHYKARQQALDEVAAIFDFGDEPLPPPGPQWEGRKPWAEHGAIAE